MCMTTKLGWGYWLTERVSHLYIYMTLWSCGFARSHSKLKPLYLPYHNAYGHQTWQSGDYHKGPKSHNPKVTWFCEITWQTKTIISPLPQCLRPPNLAKLWVTMSGSYPYSHIIIWFIWSWRIHMINVKHLPGQNGYGH